MDKLAVVVPSRGLTPRQEYMKQWRANNKARIKASRKAYYEAHREEAREAASEWTRTHREEDRAKSRAYRRKPGSREHHNNYLKKWRAKKTETDPSFRLKSVLRARLRRAIVSNLKSGSAVRDLGCSVEQLYVYLEAQFKEGMSWNNWGTHGWHIDHKKPLSHFDLTDREQFIQACHYTNLQPLWAEDNMKKGNRWIN